MTHPDVIIRIKHDWSMSLNIAKVDKKRVVIVGGGFGGLKLANKLKKSGFQVVLIDKNNYHQFPPLIYQVASAGMEPTSISFPFRKIFQHRKDFYFRMAEVRAIFPEKNMIQTSIGKAEYDYLVLAAGTTTNFFGNKHIEEEAMPMKNVSEAMGLRNALLANLERALTCSTKQEQQELPDTQRLLTAGQLKKLEKLLWKKDNTARELLLKNCPDRLHTIYTGMLILDELVELSQCETIYISQYGVREGYLRRELARKRKA
jgi:uncharacterized UPF0146 family protein